MDSMVRLRWMVLLVLIVVALVSSLWALSRTGDWEGLALNLGAEMVGAVVTYALFELVIARRERREAEQRALEQEKKNLVTQMGTMNNAEAKEAVRILRVRGWLTDGTLCRAFLGGVNLHGANLQAANLQQVFLGGANLREANLLGACLIKAYLGRANLTDANMCGADLRGANLTKANLTNANLEVADLREAKVTGQQLAQAASLKGAILSDGVASDWLYHTEGGQVNE